MAITNGYTDLATFYQRFYTLQGTEESNESDTALESVIEGVSRAIDHICNRRFYVASETRYYTARDYRQVFTDDFTGITALKTDDDDDATYENTWTTSDYHTMPINAALDGEPYTWLRITSNGSYTFPKNIKGISLQATFGYSATTPAVVAEACLLGSAQVFKRKDAVYGVAGTNALGLLQVIEGELRRDAHFMWLLSDVMRAGIGDL